MPFNVPRTPLRFHLHVDENMQETEHDSDEVFAYMASCLRHACVMAKRLQCTVWFEDVFMSYKGRTETPMNLYVNPSDEYDEYLEWYFKENYSIIVSKVSEDVLKNHYLR